MDLFSKYANVFVTGTYVYVALLREVSFVSMLNLFAIVIYFSRVTYNVGKRSVIL
jgi:hypothetical protein